MSHQDGAWHDSNFICDYWNLKFAQNASFKNHKKNFIINLKPMYPLYDRCHIKKEYDITPISVVITVKWKLLRTQVLRITRKTLSSIQSQCIRCMTNVTSRQKLTWTPVSLWSLQKRNSFETRAQETQENFIIMSKPMYPLDEKCHIKTENDMNCKFIVIIAKWDLLTVAS